MRLTKELRKRIKDQIIEHRFNDDKSKLDQKKDKFALKVYTTVFSKKERELLVSLPEGWTTKLSSFQVNLGGETHRFYLSEKLIFPGGYSNYSTVKAYDGSHALSEEKAKLICEKQNFNAEVNSAKADINAILTSVSTIKRLKEAWPEITTIVDNLAPEEKIANFPAVRMQDLNKSLKLPVAKEK